MDSGMANKAKCELNLDEGTILSPSVNLGGKGKH